LTGHTGLTDDVIVIESCVQHIPHISTWHTSIIHGKLRSDDTRRVRVVSSRRSLSHHYLNVDLFCSGQLQATERLAVLWWV